MGSYITDPRTIEEESMRIIGKLLGTRAYSPLEERIIKRIIHTTADFDFADTTIVSPLAGESFRQALRGGKMKLVVDTMMIAAGLNRRLLQQFGVTLECHVQREDVSAMAQKEGITRSMAGIRCAAAGNPRSVFVIGNAPTALYEVLRLSGEGVIDPALVVGVPVGFVGAAESKEALLKTGLPHICTRGRKGGSTVAVAIMHALFYHYS